MSRWGPWRAGVLGFVAGGLVVGLVVGLVMRSPDLPRQYRVEGTVHALDAAGTAFVLDVDGERLGFALDYSTQGRQYITQGSRLRLTILAGEGLPEIVAEAVPLQEERS